MSQLVLSLALLVGLIGGGAWLKRTELLNWLIPGASFTLTKDIAYGVLARQKMDVYLPHSSLHQKAFKPKPVIVFIHGGSWRTGDKRDYRFVAHALIAQGHAVVIPNYRLYPEVNFPSFINDIALAVKILEKQASTLLNEPLAEFILMGHSAGAHTAALLTTNLAYFDQHHLTAQQVALIGLAGPYDLDLQHPEVAPVFMPQASSDNALATLNVPTNLPPVLLLHGVDDIRVGIHHADRFKEALLEQGNKVSLRKYPNVNHMNVLIGMAAPLRFLSPTYKDIHGFLSRW